MRRTKSIGFVLAGVMLVVLVMVAFTGCEATSRADQSGSTVAAVEQSVLDSTCKVSTSSQATTSQQCTTDQPGGSVGTGFAFLQDANHIWVMTNRHVVGAKSVGKTVYTTWWRAGHQSKKLPMKLMVVSQEYDIAVGKIRTGLFRGLLPRIVPLSKEVSIVVGTKIVTAGCPNGDWLTATQGHVTKITPTSFQYLPSPHNGRSGSPIYNGTGSEVVGLCFQRVGRQGRAYTARTLRRLWTPRVASAKTRSISAKNCPTGICPTKPKTVPVEDVRIKRLTHRKCQPKPEVAPGPGPIQGEVFPGLPPLDVDIDVAAPAIPMVKTVGMVAPIILTILAFVIGFVVLLGRQLFGKIK